MISIQSVIVNKYSEIDEKYITEVINELHLLLPYLNESILNLMIFLLLLITSKFEHSRTVVDILVKYHSAVQNISGVQETDCWVSHVII